jgi:hypothetical protein
VSVTQAGRTLVGNRAVFEALRDGERNRVWALKKVLADWLRQPHSLTHIPQSA